MYKSLAVVFLALIVGVAARKPTFLRQSTHIERALLPNNAKDVTLDWCPQCINTFDDLVQVVLDVILQYGVLDTCGHLCDIVEEKTGSGVLGMLCSLGCDFVGLEEFVKLMEKTDIDPIYYCESLKLCPSEFIGT